jgi:hypothetical protein
MFFNRFFLRKILRLRQTGCQIVSKTAFYNPKGNSLPIVLRNIYENPNGDLIFF